MFPSSLSRWHFSRSVSIPFILDYEGFMNLTNKLRDAFIFVHFIDAQIEIHSFLCLCPLFLTYLETFSLEIRLNPSQNPPIRIILSDFTEPASEWNKIVMYWTWRCRVYVCVGCRMLVAPPTFFLKSSRVNKIYSNIATLAVDSSLCQLPSGKTRMFIVANTPSKGFWGLI